MLLPLTFLKMENEGAAPCSGRLALTLTPTLTLTLTQTLTQTLTLTLTLTRFRLLQWATALRVLPPGGLQGEAQRISRRGMLRAPPLYMYSA